MSESGLLLRGSLLRTCALFASLAIAFFLTPFIIGAIGQRQYGLWALVGTIVGYYGFLDFGLSKAAQQFIARAIGSGKPADVNRIITTAFALFALIGLTACALSVAIAFLSPMFFDLPDEQRVFAIVMLVLGVNVLLSFPMMAFNGLFSAHLRYDIVSYIGLAQLLVRSALIVVFLARGHGLIALAVITTAVDAGAHAVRLALAWRLFPQTTVRPSLYDPGQVRPLFGYGGKAFVHSLADLLRFHVDVLVVTAFLNLSAVAVYSIAGQLAAYFRSLIGMLFGVLVPVYARHEAGDDRAHMRETFALTSRLAASLAVLLGGGAIVFGGAFLDLWLGEAFAASYPVLVLLLLGTMLHVAQEPALALVYGTARHGPYAKVALAEGVANLVLSLVLVQFWGLAGVALGTSVPMVLSAGFLMVHVCRYLGCSLLAHARMLLRAGILGAALHALAWILVQRAGIDSWSELLLYAAIVLPLQALVLGLLVFDNGQRRRMRDAMRAMWQRRESGAA